MAVGPETPRVLGVGSSKGGVGKTQTAVTLAHLATEQGYRVLLADADPNLSASDWATRAEGMTFDVDDLQDGGPAVLTRLRELRDYDLVVVDLPGAKSSDAWSALLHGTAGAPVLDALVVPSAVRTMDLRPVVRVIRDAVIPAGVPYLLVGTLVKTPSLPNALQELGEIAAGPAGISVARTVIRDLTVHAEAVTWDRAVTEMPGGRHSTARAAEREYRNLAFEVFAGLLGMKWSSTQEEVEV